MNLRTSLALLLVVAVLGGLWFATGGSGSGSGGGVLRGGAGPGAEALFPASPLAVKVERPGDGFVLRREGGLWSQVSPAWFPLSAEAGQEVARVLAGAVVREKHLPGEAGATLAEASLEESIGTVEVVAAAGVTRVRLGESTPGGRSFAFVEESPEPGLGGHVVTLPEGLHRFAFARRDGGWYEHAVPLPPLSAVVAMRVAGAAGAAPVGMVREAGVWRLEDDGAPVLPAIVERMQALPGALLVQDFLTPTASAGPAAFGLRSPSAVWELEEAGGRVTRLRLGRGGGLGDDGVYAELERTEGSTTLTSPILKLPPIVGFLGGGRASFADPRVFPVEASDARLLELRSGDGGADAVVAAVAVEAPAGPAWATPPASPGPAPADLLTSVLSLAGERRLLPPDRAGPSGGPGAGGGDEETRSRTPGYAGRLVLEHGLTGRIEVEAIRRRQRWFLRVVSDPFGVEYALDDASADRFESAVLPLLTGPGR